MALRYIDGFDSYATSDLPFRYNAVNSATIASSSGRNGSGALQLAQFQSISKTINIGSTWIMGFGFRTTNFPGSNDKVVAWFDGSNEQLEIDIWADGTLSISRNGTALTNGRGTTGLLANTYYYIEIMFTVSTSIAANSCILRINGINEIVVATGQNIAGAGSGSTQITNFQLARSYGGGVGSPAHLIDDLYICDSSGSVNNAFLGDVRVETIRPTGDGSLTDFSLTGAASHHACVNQTTGDGDTTYVSSDTLNQQDTYAFGSLATTPTTIFGIQTVITARKDDAGIRGVAAIVKYSGTVSVGSTDNLPDSYQTFTEIREQSPAAAAWTATDINALEAGVKLVN